MIHAVHKRTDKQQHVSEMKSIEEGDNTEMEKTLEESTVKKKVGNEKNTQKWKPFVVSVASTQW